MHRTTLGMKALALATFALIAPPAFAGKPAPQPPPPPPSPSTICYSWSGYHWEANENGIVNSGVQLPETARAPSELRHEGNRWWLSVEDADGDASAYNPELFAYVVGSAGVTRIQVTGFYPTLRLTEQSLHWSGKTTDGVRTPDAFVSMVAVDEFNTTSQLVRLTVSPSSLAAMELAGELPLSPQNASVEKVLVELTPLSNYRYRNHRWSPDGHSLAFVSREGPDNYSLRTIFEDGTAEAALVAGRYSMYTPAWSPDGTRVSFASTQYASEAGTRLNVTGTWVVAASGGTAVLIFDRRTDRPPFWSPDGNWLALRVVLSNKVTPGFTASPDTEILRIPATGGSYVNLTADISGQPDLYGWVQN